MEPLRKPTDHLSPRQARFLLEAAREGLDASITAISERAGLHRWTFYSWLRKSPVFRAAWQALPQQILERQLPRVIAAMVERAIAGSDACGVALLRHGLGERVAHEVSGKLGLEHSGSVEVKVVAVPEPERQASILDLMARHNLVDRAAAAIENAVVKPNGANGHDA